MTTPSPPLLARNGEGVQSDAARRSAPRAPPAARTGDPRHQGPDLLSGCASAEFSDPSPRQDR